MTVSIEDEPSAGIALLLGATVGFGALVLYVVGGFAVGGWNLQDFLAHLTVETVGSLLLAGGIAMAVFAIPVAAWLRFHLVSPLVVLIVVVTGWLVYGAAIGILTAQTVFGLAIYALYLVPLYVALYLVTGGVEHVVRRRG